MATNEITPVRAKSEVLGPYSRFFDQDLFIINNKKVWGTWEIPEIPNSPNDIYHTVTQADAGRLDLISYEYYKTPELKWVIASVNGIFFPAEEIVENLVLRIPDINQLTNLGLIR